MGTKDTTTAWMHDGRKVEVPEIDVTAWQYEVADRSTHAGLADWYTQGGDEHLEAISGEPEDGARCAIDHVRTVRVVNAAQAEQFSFDAPHASVRVCAERACVLDAMAYIQRCVPDDRPVWTADPEGSGQRPVFHDRAPLPEERLLIRAGVQTPLSVEALRERTDEHGVVDVMLVYEDFDLAGVTDWSSFEDLVHEQAIGAGHPEEPSLSVVQTDRGGRDLIIRYRTKLATAPVAEEGDTE